jgi:hypothetical protein
MLKCKSGMMKSINCGQKPVVGLLAGEFFLLHT